MRRYDTVILRDLVQARPLNPPLLQGLTILYRRRPPLRPLIVSLTPDRPIREDEYAMIELRSEHVQSQRISPHESQASGRAPGMIPATAVQIVSGRAARPGRLRDDRHARECEPLGGPAWWHRSDRYCGQVRCRGRAHVHSTPSIDFVFVPRGVAIPAGAAAARASKVLLAEGSIKLALLSLIRVGIVPEGDGRLRQRHTIELTLERRPMTLSPEERGNPPPPLALPSPSPTPNEANSWVVFDGPEGRFHFWHPQEYLSPGAAIPDTIHIRVCRLEPPRGTCSALRGTPHQGEAITTQEQQFRDPAAFKRASRPTG